MNNSPVKKRYFALLLLLFVIALACFLLAENIASLAVRYWHLSVEQRDKFADLATLFGVLIAGITFFIPIVLGVTGWLKGGDNTEKEKEKENMDNDILQLSRIKLRLNTRNRQKEETAAEPAKRQNTGRYLRRRCRYIESGTNKFKMIMYSLLSHKHQKDDAIKLFKESWESLNKPYERVMAHCAYLECTGNITQLRSVIEKERFTDKAESTRKLYEAIACEKLDDLDRAQELLGMILDTEKNPNILRAAQFNRHVCYEKANNFKNVDFEAFFEDKNVMCIDGERLSDKALAMHVIVCQQQGHSFAHMQSLHESLKFLSQHSKAGYAKTLLTKTGYEGSHLNPESIDAIIINLNHTDANTRMAIMVQLFEYLPAQAKKQREDILNRVSQEPDIDETILKWKESHSQQVSSHETDK